MKKVVLLLLSFVFYFNSYSQVKLPYKDGMVFFSEVVPMNGKTKPELFSLVKEWVSDYYRSSKAVIDLADEKAGVITIKGASNYVLKDWLGKVPNNWTHKLKFYFKDGKMKVEMTDIVVQTVPIETIMNGGKGLMKWSKKIRKQHAQNISDFFTAVIHSVKKKKTTTEDDW